MQQAAIPGYKLSRSKKSIKILTTLGLFGLFMGLLSSALLTISKTGLGAASVKEYYLGSTSQSEFDEVLNPSTPRTFAELAEVTHLHLVGGTMLLFLLCHLLSLCDLSEGLRIILYTISFVSFLVTFSLPWLIIYVAPSFAQLFGPAIATFISSLFVLTILPIREIWFAR